MLESAEKAYVRHFGFISALCFKCIWNAFCIKILLVNKKVTWVWFWRNHLFCSSWLLLLSLQGAFARWIQRFHGSKQVSHLDFTDKETGTCRGWLIPSDSPRSPPWVKVRTHFFFFFLTCVFCLLLHTFIHCIQKEEKGRIKEGNGFSTVFSACHFHYNYLNHLFCLEQAKEFDIKKLNCHSVQQRRASEMGPYFRMREWISILSGVFVTFSEAQCQYLITTLWKISGL